jgi:uncharacterized membrane protein
VRKYEGASDKLHSYFLVIAMVLPAAGQALRRHTPGLRNRAAAEHFAKEALRYLLFTKALSYLTPEKLSLAVVTVLAIAWQLSTILRISALAYVMMASLPVALFVTVWLFGWSGLWTLLKVLFSRNSNWARHIWRKHGLGTEGSGGVSIKGQGCPMQDKVAQFACVF